MYVRLELTQSLVGEAAEDGPSLLPMGGAETPLTLTLALVQFRAPEDSMLCLLGFYRILHLLRPGGQ